MPQFLTTSGTAHIIEDIIIRAKTQLVLITPYLKLSRILSERLAEANQRGVTIKLVYGKSELKTSEKRQLETLSNLELLYLGNLHAKCYHNDSTLIVSSMNLYEFSEKNNREMGIMLTRRDDEECFADALAEAQSIIMAARGGDSAKQVVPSSSKLLPEVATAPSLHKEFDHALKGRCVLELLRKNASDPYQFRSRKEPHAFREGYTIIVSAKDFPRRGIDMQFDGSIRFDFANSHEYQRTKERRQETINKLLAEYRCYWNRDVLQIYAAKDYELTDEQTVAAYYVHAIQHAASAL